MALDNTPTSEGIKESEDLDEWIRSLPDSEIPTPDIPADEAELPINDQMEEDLLTDKARPALERPGAFRKVSFPETEDSDLQLQYIDSITIDLLSGNTQDLQTAKAKVKSLDKFLPTANPENIESLIKEALVNKLIEFLKNNPDFKETFLEILKILMVSVVVYEARFQTSHLAAEILNTLSTSLEPEDLQNEVNEQIPVLIIENAKEANYLHSIINILSDIDSEIIISETYRLLFTDLANSDSATIDKSRLGNLLADAFIEALRQIEDASEINSLLMLIDKSQRKEEFIEYIRSKLARKPEANSIFVNRCKTLVFYSELDASARKFLIEQIVTIAGIDVVMQIVQAPSNMEDESVRETFVLLLSFIEKLVENGNKNDISRLFAFLGQLGLRIDFLKPEWNDIALEILGIFNEYKLSDNENVKLALNDILISSFTSKIINSLKVALTTGTNEANRASEKFLRVIILDEVSIFTSEQRVDLYKSIITANNIVYLNFIQKILMLNEAAGIEDIVSGNGDFSRNNTLKIQIITELNSALELKIEQKRQIIDDYLNTEKGSRLIFALILKDDEALEYYREVILGTKEKELGTQTIDKELGDIKINIIDTIDSEKRTERLQHKIDDVNKRWRVRILMLFSSSEVQKRLKKREIAQNEVAKTDTSNLEKGLNQLLVIVQSPERNAALLTAINSNPESYAIVVNVLEEIYQFREELELNGKTLAIIERLLRAILGDNKIIRQMPEHIRVLKLEMWKDRLDEFEDSNSEYGKSKREILTKKGVSVALDSLNKREKKKYESRLTKKFLALSSPRGECLSEIISLHQNDPQLFDVLIGQAEFSNVIEYAIDQYKRYPDQFLEISEAEKEFLLFLMTNETVWSKIDNRIKFKISEQVLLLWSKEDSSGFEILNILLEESNDAVDYSFVNSNLLDFIGAVYQQMPTEIRAKLAGFAKINEKKSRLQRVIDGLRRSEESEYAYNLNYLISYLATRNRINAKHYYTVVDNAIQEAAIVQEQVQEETLALKTNQGLQESASDINSSGELLTTEKLDELKPKLTKSFETVILFVKGFKMAPPLTFREQDEVLEMIPKLIDLLVYATEIKTNPDEIKKVLIFLKKLLEQSNPSYFKPGRVYIELFENISSQLKKYSSITSDTGFEDLIKELEEVKNQCEIQALGAVEAVFSNTVKGLTTPFRSHGDVIIMDTYTRVSSNNIQKLIKPSIELLYSNPELVKKMIQSKELLLLNALASQLGRVLVYLNYYINDVALVRQLEYFVVNTALYLSKDQQKLVLDTYKNHIEKIQIIKRSKQRVLPTSIKNNLNKLAA